MREQIPQNIGGKRYPKAMNDENNQAWTAVRGRPRIVNGQFMAEMANGRGQFEWRRVSGEQRRIIEHTFVKIQPELDRYSRLGFQAPETVSVELAE